MSKNVLSIQKIVKNSSAIIWMLLANAVLVFALAFVIDKSQWSRFDCVAWQYSTWGLTLVAWLGLHVACRGYFGRLKDMSATAEKADDSVKTTRRIVGKGKVTTPSLTRLREFITGHFSDPELHILCSDLGVGYYNLPPGGKAYKVLELVEYMDRRNSIPDLIKQCRKARPKVKVVTGSFFAQVIRLIHPSPEVLPNMGLAVLTIMSIAIVLFLLLVKPPQFRPREQTPSLDSFSMRYSTGQLLSLDHGDLVSILAGETVSIYVTTSIHNLRFRWTTQKGKLSSTDMASILYTAPSLPGQDTLELETADKCSITRRSITIQVVRPTPTSTPTLTPTPTFTPTPTPTQTPTHTPTPSPSPDSTPRPTPDSTPIPSPTLTPTPSRTPTPCATCTGCFTGRGTGCPGNMTRVPGTTNDYFCTDTLILSPTMRASSIRIVMTKRSMESYGYSLDEVEAYGPDNSSANLLLNGTASARSVSGGLYAQYAIDGKLPAPGAPNRWDSAHCCPGGNCSKDEKGNLVCDNQDGQDPQWLEITFPSAQINRIVLKWQEAYAIEYCVIVNP
jgi:hypothetical protein